MADQVTCDGPEDCSGSTPVCCGVDVGNGQGTFPTCGATSIGATCSTANNCKTSIAQSCSATQKVQLCHHNSDCTNEASNNKCCTFSSGAASLTFCSNTTTANLGGGTCM